VVVRSNVSGDLLSIDGQVLGPTSPETHALVPGRHIIVVNKAGHSPWKSIVELAPGEARTLRAKLVPLTPTSAAAKPAASASWSDTVRFVREKLRDRWESGDPPSEFEVSDAGVMAFRLRNPSNTAVWHHYRVDVRELAVAPDDLAPSVVRLECRVSLCFHHETCRDGNCVRGAPQSQQRWFLSDATQGEKLTRALDHLIELARQRPAAVELF
jgi:hypothetical protein